MKRGWLAYLIIAALLWGVIDHDWVTVRALNFWGHIPKHLVNYSLGKTEYKPKTLRDGIFYYKMFAKTIDRNGDAYGVIGFCYYCLKDYPRALKYYKKALKEKEHEFAYYYNMSIIYLMMKDKENMIKMYRKAATLNPKEIRTTNIVENMSMYFYDPMTYIQGYGDKK